MDDVLKEIYYDPKHPASFSGPKKLFQEAKKRTDITLKQVGDWLASQENYTLHKELRRKFPRSRVFVEGIDSQWQGDLMDLSRLASENDGFKFALLVVDVYSRHVWTAPMKNKTGTETVRALKKILDSTTRQMQIFISDAGKEFLNGSLQAFLKSKGIRHVTMRNETKAMYAERAIKTIKTKLFKYMTQEGKFRWIDVLADVTKAYNHTQHRSLGRSPVEVTKDTEDESRIQQYFLRRKVKPKSSFKYALGDVVRISRLKRPFERQYDEKWTGELFTVKKRYFRDG
ncbi:MAG: transposase family protein, partial [Candidatus Omnitrophica bacterium]|nr:transposase family protein [Candidatus Omnitrophota bacterium]